MVRYVHHFMVIEVMTMRKTTVIILFLVGIGAGHAAAQLETKSLQAPPQHLKFDHVPNHLLDWVTSIFQDQEGYIWLGNEFTGLFRYDGYSAIRFVNDPDNPTSMSGNHVRAIWEDRDGIMWLGMGGTGLNRFDRNTEVFRSFMHDADDSVSLSHNWVNAILEDSQGTLWIATQDGVNRLDRETETFTSFRPDSINTAILALVEDQQGVIWTGSWGLNRFDPATGQFTRFLPYPLISNPDGGFQPNYVNAIHEDPKGRLWVGTFTGGLYQFDRERETFVNYRNDPSRPLPFDNDNIRTIVDDPGGGLWLATQREGLVWLDPDTGEMTGYRRDDLDIHSVSGDNIRSLYADRQGILWIGALNTKLDRLDRASNPFEHMYSRPGDLNSLSSTIVGGSIFEGPDGILWVTAGCTLNRIDRISGEVSHFSHDPTDPTSIGVCARAVLVDATGIIWTGGNGEISWMDPEHPGSFTNYSNDPNDSSSLPVGQIRAMFEDSNGKLWIGSGGFGLSRLEDRETGILTRFALGTGMGLPNSFFEDYDGSIWIGSDPTGLVRFNPDTGEFVNYMHEPGNAESISSSKIYGICSTLKKPDVLWVAAVGGGLNRFDKREKIFSHFTVQNSDLPDNGGQGLICDDAGHVWISTDMGLSRYDPDTGVFKNFDIDDGLQSLEFISWAYHKSRNTGELFFGGANGLNAFFPDEVRDNPNPPIVTLTSLQVGRNLIEQGQDSMLSGRLAETTSLTLSHTQNDLTLGFVGLHFRQPEKNRYTYILEGYDDTWSDTTDIRQATYTNLPSGDYTFRVTAANSDGVWNPEPATLAIAILPPWWATWWAYLIYAGMLGFIGFRTDRWQRARIAERERQKQQEALSHAHTELESTHSNLKAAQAQLVEQEKLASLGALTAGIAHEIKNPLNFVNNFAEVGGELTDDLAEAIGKNLTEDARSILSEMRANSEQITKHGRRADDIVRSMMQHARGGVSEREDIAVNVFLEEYANLAWHGMWAREHGFQAELKRDYERSVGSLSVLPQELGRVILNLLNNAFDAVRGVDGAEVTIASRSVNGGVEISVSDNGHGIPDEIRDKIFEPFFTTKATGEGTGLGLSLSYDIITKAHGGSMTVGSSGMGGAEFTITLPVES